MSSWDDKSESVLRNSEDEGALLSAADTSQGKKANQEIDLQALANKVFALLKQELRVERERLGRK